MRALILSVAAAGLGLVALSALPAGAADAKLTSCKVGQKVLMPGGYPGTVTAVYGQGGCTVKDEKGLESSWAAFMLTAVGGAPAGTTAKPSNIPAPGTYQCYGGSAGNMKLSFSAGNTYANEQGKKGTYVLRPSGQMEFKTGPWAGFYAKTLEAGKVGLTSKPDGTFYQMTCDKR